MMARTLSIGTPGTSSRRLASSSVICCGRISLRVETNCPALIITPPVLRAKRRNSRA